MRVVSLICGVAAEVYGLFAHVREEDMRAVHSLPFFAKADSHNHVCPAGQCNAGVAISTIVARRQNLNVIEVNLYQLYLDLKLSAIDPQSIGLKKKRSSIATGF